MTGGLLQLVAYGAQDLYLTGNPQTSLFVTAYKRHTNFSMESIQQFFTGEFGFGKKIFCNLDRIGDLVSKIFLEIKLPSLDSFGKEDEDGEFTVGWVNSLGFALIDYVELEIGGTVIDKHYGMWMEIWYELSTPIGKRKSGDILIGKDDQVPDINERKGPYRLYIPLMFWFCRHPGMALPLIALQYQDVRINIQFNRLQYLWNSTNGKLDNDKCLKFTDKYIDINNASLYVDYIFLENEERKLFVNKKHNYLIEQVQINTQSYETGVTDIIFNMDFSHPVKEIFWIIQNTYVLEQTSKNEIMRGNEIFNFSDRPYASGLSPLVGPGGEYYNRNTPYGSGVPADPMEGAEIQFEGQPRVQYRDSSFYRLVQPFQYHTNSPNSFIYMYSFALNPEEIQPSGACNFSRLDHVDMRIKLVSNNKGTTIEETYLIEPRINMFALNYNILQIASGMAGLAYSA